jgi:hypothetical protein
MERPNIEKVDFTVPSPLEERLGQLKELIPEAFTEGKVDPDKLLAALGEDVDTRKERYSFLRSRKYCPLSLLYSINCPLTVFMMS